MNVSMNVRRPALAAACAFALLLAGTARASGPACFTEQAQFGARATIAVAWADADGDGDLDLAVGNYQQPNQLFLNNGDGSFTEQAQFGTGVTFAVAWADFDADGDADLAVGRGSNQQNLLFVNNGNGTFTQQSQFGTLSTISLAWADCELDGDLDLAVGNGILGAVQQNYLYRNNGDGTFTQEAQFGTGQTCSVVWGDADGDGDPDLAVGNGGFGSVGQNYLYLNNGDGTFTARAEFGLGDTASLSWGDCDNDGDLDLAVGNWNGGPNLLYVNDGNANFTSLTRFGARDANTLSWGDADNDGDLDMAVGNGDFQSADSNYVYLNEGGGNFTEQAAFGLGSTDALAWGDADGDGRLEVACGNEHSPTQNYLYRNCSEPAGWLEVRTIGHFHDRGPGFSNRDGIGAKVSVYAAGHLGDPSLLLGFREISAHGGFSAQDAKDAHFGLPGRTAVDVRIAWPGSAHIRYAQDLVNVPVGQKITVDETAPAVEAPPAGARSTGELLRIVPNPSTGPVRISLAKDLSRAQAVEILDAAGRAVRTLTLSAASTGQLRADWDGRTDRGSAAPAGIYLVRATGEADREQPGRLIVVK